MINTKHNIKRVNKVSFNKLYRISLKDNIFDKSENESLCDTFTKYLDETKNESFYKYQHTKKNYVFSSRNKLKLNLEPSI